MLFAIPFAVALLFAAASYLLYLDGGKHELLVAATIALKIAIAIVGIPLLLLFVMLAVVGFSKVYRSKK